MPCHLHRRDKMYNSTSKLSKLPGSMKNCRSCVAKWGTTKKHCFSNMTHIQYMKLTQVFGVKDVEFVTLAAEVNRTCKTFNQVISNNMFSCSVLKSPEQAAKCQDNSLEA